LLVVVDKDLQLIFLYGSPVNPYCPVLNQLDQVLLCRLSLQNTRKVLFGCR